jgi:MFS transporter, OPA family, hexose phosphate transport protein UhpT
VQCISYFQMGALLGCVTWGWISDKLGGRPGMVATLCAIVVPITVFSYQHSHSPMALYISLFFLGMFIFGSQTLINISVLLQIPKRAAVVAGGWTGLFAYLFGDSSAKIMLARIADPTKSGFNFFGHVLHGWNDTFVILYFAAAMALILLGLTAIKEERMLRASKAAR